MLNFQCTDRDLQCGGLTQALLIIELHAYCISDTVDCYPRTLFCCECNKVNQSTLNTPSTERICSLLHSENSREYFFLWGIFPLECEMYFLFSSASSPVLNFGVVCVIFTARELCLKDLILSDSYPGLQCSDRDSHCVALRGKTLLVGMILLSFLLSLTFKR